MAIQYIPKPYIPSPVTVRGLPLNCDDCNEPFNSGIALMEHMVKIHKVSPHIADECDYCNMEFGSNQELIEHAKLDEIMKTTGPILMNSVIIEPKELMSTEEEEICTYHCTICNNQYTSETALDKHIEHKHKTIPHDQKICLKLTADLTEDLSKIVIPDKEQLKMDTAEKESKADLLDILNSDFSDIKREDKCEENFKCNHCNFTTSGSRSLRMHNKTMHSKTQQLLKCDICKATAKNRGGLVHHMKTSHQENVKCKTCQFTAASPSYLKIHMKRKHNTDPHGNYQCDECSETFETRTSLVQHKRRHIVALKCHLCEFKGISVTDLKYHTIQKHVQENSPLSGVKRESSIKITKESKKSQKMWKSKDRGYKKSHK